MLESDTERVIPAEQLLTRLDRLEAMQERFAARLHSLDLRSEDGILIQQATSSAFSLRIEELESRIVNLAVSASRPEQATNCVRPINEMFDVLSARLDLLQSHIEGRAAPEPQTQNANSVSEEVDTICVGDARWTNHLIHPRSRRSTSSSVPAPDLDVRNDNHAATASAPIDDDTPKHPTGAEDPVRPFTADYPSEGDLRSYCIGQSMIHPKRGMGRVVQLVPNVEKFCTVEFDGGERRSYSKNSMEEFKAERIPT